jgi:hypothetical protein
MIPAIGFMIGAYIILRALEIIFRSESQFVGPSGRGIVLVVAVIAILVTVVSMLDLYTAGSSVSHLPSLSSLP